MLNVFESPQKCDGGIASHKIAASCCIYMATDSDALTISNQRFFKATRTGQGHALTPRIVMHLVP